jgi:PAS domain S-box-containing protein
MKTVQERLTSAMKAGNLAWWEMDLPSGTVRYNDNKIQMMGYTAEEFHAEHYSDFTNLIHPDDYEKTMQAMRDHLEGKKERYEVDYRIKTKEGKWLYFHDRGTITQRDAKGKPAKMTGIVVDISDRIKMEKELIHKNELYQEAFTQAIFYHDLLVHDINNIMQSILSSVQLSELLLVETPSSERIRELLTNIEINIGKGANFIRQVNELAKILEDKSGTPKIDLLESINKAVDYTKTIFPNKEGKITFQVKSTIPKGNVILGDLLIDALTNILRNAIQHNNKELIVIQIILSEITHEEQHRIKIEIIDNGPGIDDEYKEKIFSKSYKTRTESSGMGIGLYLVKKIVESYQGHIHVEDYKVEEEKLGSNFVIMLPIKD